LHLSLALEPDSLQQAEAMWRKIIRIIFEPRCKDCRISSKKIIPPFQIQGFSRAKISTFPDLLRPSGEVCSCQTKMFAGKVTMPEIFNLNGISRTNLPKLGDRFLEASKVAWAGEENDTLTEGRAVDGIIASLVEYLRGEAPHLRPDGPRIVPEMALKDKDIH
jgi:hypothetical protein